MSRLSEMAGYAVVLLLFLVGGGGLALFQASMEARTFNRITGQNVTAWEALWVELRVDCRDGAA